MNDPASPTGGSTGGSGGGPDDLRTGDPISGATGPSTGEARAVPPVPRKSFGRRHWGKLTLLVLFGVPLAGLALWVVIGLSYTYSAGDRTGHVQKISSKGWLCKTWEGTLYTSIAKGFATDSFNFSVRNDSLAHEIEKLSGKRVAVTYKQHTLLPTSCFGDSEYFVSSVREVPE